MRVEPDAASLPDFAPLPMALRGAGGIAGPNHGGCPRPGEPNPVLTRPRLSLASGETPGRLGGQVVAGDCVAVSRLGGDRRLWATPRSAQRSAGIRDRNDNAQASLPGRRALTARSHHFDTTFQVEGPRSSSSGSRCDKRDTVDLQSPGDVDAGSDAWSRVMCMTK